MPVNEIQSGRFNAILRKLFSMDVGAPTPSLATDLFPMVAVEVDRPEWSFLGGVRLCAGRWSDAAVGGNYSHVGLRNPAGSGTLIIVRRIQSGFSASSAIRIGWRANGTVDASNAMRPIDSRWGAAYSTGLLTELTQAAVAVYPLYSVQGSAQLVCQVPWILSPGYELFVHCQSTGTAVEASFYWEERRLEASESR